MNPIDGADAKQQFQNYTGSNPFIVNGEIIKGFSLEKEMFLAIQDVMDHYVQAGQDPEEFRLYLGREPKNNALALMVVGVQNQVELTDYIRSVNVTMKKTGPCPPNCDKTSTIIN